MREVLSRRYRRAFQTSFEADRVRFHMLSRLGITTIVAPPGLTRDPAWTPERVAPLRLRQSYDGADGQVFVLEQTTGGPWLVHATEVVAGPTAAIVRFTDPRFDERRAVILERANLPADTAISSGKATQLPSEVRVKEDGINTLRVVVRTARPGWLVVPNIWDQGWHARAAGREVPVVRANYCLQAVPIAPGEGEECSRYRPQGFWAAAAVSAIAVIGTLIGALVVGSRRFYQTTALSARSSINPDPHRSLHNVVAFVVAGSRDRAAALHAPESSGARQRDSAAGSAVGRTEFWRHFGDGEGLRRKDQWLEQLNWR